MHNACLPASVVLQHGAKIMMVTATNGTQKTALRMSIMSGPLLACSETTHRLPGCPQMNVEVENYGDGSQRCAQYRRSGLSRGCSHACSRPHSHPRPSWNPRPQNRSLRQSASLQTGQIQSAPTQTYGRYFLVCCAELSIDMTSARTTKLKIVPDSSSEAPS